MKSKAPLILMEQMVMLLVFALAAALCLQAFVHSGSASRRNEARDHAATRVQTAAELIRNNGGDTDEALFSAARMLDAEYEQGLLQLDYDEDWNPAHNGVYHLTAQGVPTEIPGLNKVRIAIEYDGSVLFEIETAWQAEVVLHG